MENSWGRVTSVGSAGEKAPPFGSLGAILDLTSPEPIQACHQFSYPSGYPSVKEIPHLLMLDSLGFSYILLLTKCLCPLKICVLNS